MDDASIHAVVSEIKPLLIGRAPGKISQLDASSLAIDFGLRDRGYLFMSVEPALPRLYLIKRRVRDLEKQSIQPGKFVLALRKELSQAGLVSLEKDDRERIVRLRFRSKDELGKDRERALVVQLTGRSANLLLLDGEGVIVTQARAGQGVGQKTGQKYQPPHSQRAIHPPTKRGVRGPTNRGSRAGIPLGVVDRESHSISEALDARYTALAIEKAFQTKAAAAQGELRRKITRQQKLLAKLERDLASHADAAQHKRIGDLLLANVSSAKRKGDRVKLIDYFAEGEPQIEIEMDAKLSLSQEATRRFEMYSRSKRAQKQIAARIEKVKSDLADLDAQEKQLEQSIAARDEEAFSESPMSAGWPISEPPAVAGGPKRQRTARIPGTRRYLSSDGFEILVGRAAKDNDSLTFKVARPNDLWLHAADYPGSHVVVRNPTRKEIPHRTIIEAAQLAAHFSQANKDPKVDVHYTQRKFLSKPKGAAPGLVRMSRFKNLTVRPKELAHRVL
jgi:predicted ribosome quality control (RQC) complex YloA/Tae2 family protein